MKSILFGQEHRLLNVYPNSVLAKLKEHAGLSERVFGINDLEDGAFPDTEFIFSTWGMPGLKEEQIARFFPALKAVFYAAGSVQGFAYPFLAKGIRVFSAWAANAVPVAEFAAAQIILAGKNYFKAASAYKQEDRARLECEKARICGNFRINIGIIGAGMIGAKTIELLNKFSTFNILVFDPFLSSQRAEELKVRLCPLEEIFSSCQVVSNHLADNAQTKKMLTYGLFMQMPEGAAFINTGRGAQIDEDGLVRALTERTDLTALLDVTFPEPPAAGHPFYSLPNVFLSPHIAGSMGNEVHRMAEYMLEEFLRFSAGGSARYEVTLDMLKTMA